MIYRSDLRQEGSDRLMSMHTCREFGDVQRKISASTGFGKEIAGLDEDEEYLASGREPT